MAEGDTDSETRPGAYAYEFLKRTLKENKVSASSSSSSSSESFIIFRAPPKLREVNEKAFKPQIISIGPFHWATGPYETMDIQKYRYLQQVLERLASGTDGGANVDEVLKSLVVKAQSIKERARNCYDQVSVSRMSQPDFVTMMVLDGLFVVELLRKFHDPNLRLENDIIFKQNSNLTIIAQDLLLLENQLPFFVLDLLFEQTKHFVPGDILNGGMAADTLQEMASNFFSVMVPVQPRDDGGNAVYDIEDIKHLLGLVHNRCLPSPQEYTIFVQSSSSDVLDQWELDKIEGRLNVIRSATRLKEAGIRFKKREVNNLFDIKFKNGQMHIPTLTVDHDTDRIFRNLIAYEQLHQGSSIVMDYARLMDCLINYADDVALLSDSGIIDNMLGTNEDVANLFNKLNEYVYLSTANFYYSKIFHDVNEYCNRPWNKWKVRLKQKYFNTPWNWVLTSIVAASILLLLSFLQTLFSILSYHE